MKPYLGHLDTTDESEDDQDEREEDTRSLIQAPAVKQWDVFEVKPPEVDSGSAAAMVWIKRFEKLMLVVAYLLTCLIVFCAATVSKGVTMFIMAQVSVRNKTLAFCNEKQLVVDTTKDYVVDKTRPLHNQAQLDSMELEQVAWVWCLIFAYMIPEVVGSFFRSLRVTLFKAYHWPTFVDLAFVATIETLHVSGLAILAFLALPQLDSAHAILLTNCLAFVPSVLLFMSRNKRDKFVWLKTPIDVVAICAQLSGALIWPLLQWTKVSKAQNEMEFPWSLPLGLILASFGWWECFVDEHSAIPFVKWMAGLRTRLVEQTRYSTYMIVSIWKAMYFMLAAWLIVSLNGLLQHPNNLFTMFVDSFDAHTYNVTEVMDVVFDDTNADSLELKTVAMLDTMRNTPLWVLLIQVGCSYLTYIFAKFACKVQIQGFSFALPLCAVVPTTATLILSACGARAKDQCAFSPMMPEYLFLECPSVGDFFHYLWDEQVWLWAVWFLSQLWISSHIWFPKSPRLASTEAMFYTPMYCSLCVDQSIVFNRRRDGTEDLDLEELKAERKRNVGNYYESYAYEEDHARNSSSGVSSESNAKKDSDNGVLASDRITKIYGCATMWHETIGEMMEMLKSIFRIDMDYSARRLAQKYMDVDDPDFYEWETHIFFDDAFKLVDENSKEQVVNQYVKLLVRILDEAGSFVHCKKIKVKPPVKYPTPYGGRLVWTLPGKTKIVCHLKDTSKIRHKKRWSQCMYMYYLLGFRLMELNISNERKQAMAETTYLLALDGDIDFQPEAVTRLVDLMKKNRTLGAACGRIHPTGSGFLVWYQRFEYAIGHWLQKATEHVMGCVLCSPGCFSLFRAAALMDFNVMRMYTTKSELPLHFVQYDQGEDRWLCTLLLQRGWRVEYSAASDAYTACPEGFNEFFNQRRRWMPSTIANIYDLLSDYKNVVDVNKDISIFYIMYQVMMMVGTVLGPGTIFLMLVGAFTAAFKISNWDSFLVNLVPILLFMIICFTLKSNIQLFVAQVLSAVYALIMMAVMVGIMLQISEDGLLAPTTLSIIMVGSSFILAAILHPQEFWCLPYGIIYYITIPAMYLLLVIYSIFNLNVVSWGTREEPKKVTKQDLEEEKKKQAALAEEAKKKKREGGLLGFLMQQASGKSEKGGLEFSLANLFKCMCFTHEDNDDPKKQLVKIATSLDDVATRLHKIEHAVGTGGGSAVTFSSFRRPSSVNRNRHSRGSTGNPLINIVSEDGSRRSSDGNAGRLLDSVEQQEMVNVPLLDEPEYEDDDESVKDQRNDLFNPAWIEDRDLRNGGTDYLEGTEIQFWKDVIEKYLEPLKKDEEKEKKQALELITLRTQMVFTFFMLNAIFVLVVFMLQQEKDLIFIRWPLGAKANVTYIGPHKNPRVEVAYDYLQLEPIGLVFVVFFAVVLILQVIGMILHRWGTLSHIIATTKLPWCEKKPRDETDDATLDREAVAIAHAFQRDDTRTKNTALKRRETIAQITANHKKTQGQGESVNLEKEFKKNYMFKSKDELLQSDNPALRRLSMRRGTFSALEKRRQSYRIGETRRNTLRRMSSLARTNEGFNNGDSAISDDYSGSAFSRNSQRESFEIVNDRPNTATTEF